jgi:hypothetical protein
MDINLIGRIDKKKSNQYRGRKDQDNSKVASRKIFKETIYHWLDIKAMLL